MNDCDRILMLDNCIVFGGSQIREIHEQFIRIFIYLHFTLQIERLNKGKERFCGQLEYGKLVASRRSYDL